MLGLNKQSISKLKSKKKIEGQPMTTDKIYKQIKNIVFMNFQQD